jgi:hypothetical protein
LFTEDSSTQEHENAIIVMTTDEGAKNMTGKFDTTSIVVIFDAAEFHGSERRGRSQGCSTGTLRFRFYFSNLCVGNLFMLGGVFKFAPSTLFFMALLFLLRASAGVASAVCSRTDATTELTATG